MTEFHHPEFITKKLLQISSEKATLREEYDALEIHLRTVGGLIDALTFQERDLQRQKTECECEAFLERLNKYKIWTLKQEWNKINPDILKIVKIQSIDYTNRRVGIAVPNNRGCSFNPFGDHFIEFEYFEQYLEPYIENDSRGDIPIG